MSILLKNGKILTMNEKLDYLTGDILVENNRIEKIGNLSNMEADEILDMKGNVILPGFIQPHIHLCQTLFRGMAEDMALLDWLKKRIWKLESEHTQESTYYSAILGLSELISCGTTTILDMGSTHHYDYIFKAATEMGYRLIGGKAMMDFGEGVPKKLGESTDDSLNECVELIQRWHNTNDGRLQYAFAPRFLLSCTDNLMIETGKLAKKYNLIIHTHSSENTDERKLVESIRGKATIPYLSELDLLSEKTVLVHCVWLKDEDFNLLKRNNVKVVHCPSSNLKLASGIADIKKMLSLGIDVSLGADGAPCNNNLNIFMEMRLAALLQKLKYGPSAGSAKQILTMATIGGARCLGLESEIGSIEIGKKADLAILNLNKLNSIPYTSDLYTRIVYSSNETNVESVMIDGKWVMKNQQIMHLPDNLNTKCNQLAKEVCNKANIQ